MALCCEHRPPFADGYVVDIMNYEYVGNIELGFQSCTEDAIAEYFANGLLVLFMNKIPLPHPAHTPVPAGDWTDPVAQDEEDLR